MDKMDIQKKENDNEEEDTTSPQSLASLKGKKAASPKPKVKSLIMKKPRKALKSETLESGNRPGTAKSTIYKTKRPPTPNSAINTGKRSSTSKLAISKYRSPSASKSAIVKDKSPPTSKSAIYKDKRPPTSKSAFNKDKCPSTSKSEINNDEQPSTSMSTINNDEYPSISMSTINNDERPSTSKSTANKDKNPGHSKSTYNKDKRSGTSKFVVNKDERPGTSKSLANKDERPGTFKSLANKDERPGTSKSLANKDEGPGTSKSLAIKDERPGTSKSLANKDERPGTSKSLANKDERPGTSKSLANKDERPGTSKSLVNKDKRQGTAIAPIKKIPTFKKKEILRTRSQTGSLPSSSHFNLQTSSLHIEILPIYGENTLELQESVEMIAPVEDDTPSIHEQNAYAVKNNPEELGDMYKPVDMATAICSVGFRHAVHCMIWAKWDESIFTNYETKAAIMMQVRFDGQLGFPGGMVDDNLAEIPNTKDRISRIVDSLNRELHEEINMDLKINKIIHKNRLFSHKNVKENIILHFYAYQIPYDRFCKLELSAMQSMEFGKEVLGLSRVPLYTMDNGYYGFPAFLDNLFAGNGRQQLVEALLKLEIMTEEEIAEARANCRRLEP